MTTTTHQVEAAVERVAAALADPRALAVQGPGRRTAPPVSLEGSAGAALFLAELARRDPGRLPLAHRHLALAAQALAATGSAGLSYGPAAVLAAAQAAAWPGGHYPRLRHNLTAHVAGEQVRRLAAEPAGPGVDWSSYDVVSGGAGIGGLLLGAVADGDAQERAAAEPAPRGTLERLVALSRPVAVDGRLLPGWWVPRHRQPTEADRAHFPRGDVNLGLAHGIAGPLALLALAAEAGVMVEGQLDAVHRIGDWLAERADHDAFGPYWEPRLPFDDELTRAGGERTAPSGFAAAASGGAWCYGAAGIAGPLLRAARLTGEDGWRALALDGARALLTRPGTHEHLKGPTVCHGQAGLLQCLWRLGRLADDPELLGHAATLAEQLAGAYRPDAAFGYRHLAPATRARGGHRPHPLAGEDGAGVLEGAAGVAAALLSTLPASGGGGGVPGAGEPYWDRVLLLS
ncbi:hypothetical protein GCM10009665_71070 [Kitasatospora nipponensis]|uniref:Lanthionine synthetase-like protein n=1 Tax=Kitasatospora nipponensis TaxID=258049 RepID=A0ABN1WYQ4_9ACTN